jgi:hypothetical protein
MRRKFLTETLVYSALCRPEFARGDVKAAITHSMKKSLTLGR